MATRLDPAFEIYLTRNRDFLAPAVSAAIERLAPPAGGRVLDVGTGGGGAVPPLAEAVGDQGVVVAADRDPGVLDLAVAHLDDVGAALRGRVRVEVFDLATAGPPIAGEPFDLVWASDVLWAGNVGDPVAAVARLTERLSPGGILALFFSNYYEASFLPGHPALARRARAASERRWGLHASGAHHHDRHLAWLRENALDDVTLSVLPRVATQVSTTDPAAHAYLEAVVWPEILESVGSCGTDVGMTVEEIAHLRRLLTPGDPAYVLDEPGHFVVHPTLLVTGRRRTTVR